MIFYFSATGNSRWVAKELARITGDELCDVVACIRDGVMPETPYDRIGLVFPIHSWYAPRPFVDFLDRLGVPFFVYCYAVCTCGDDAGKALDRLAKHAHFNAAWTVAMPNTYVPMFQLDSDEVAAEKIRAARQRIAEIGRYVSDDYCHRDVYEGKYPWLKTYVVNPLFVHLMVRTRAFRVDEGCVSCGKCVQACPVGNLRLKGGRPAWGRKCIHCMACLHGCPQRVIQYGNSTRQKGRYHLEDFLEDGKPGT